MKKEIEKAHPEAYKWAREFHNLYEHTAPLFGYETKQETREFNPESPNGRLMAYVCFNIVQQAVDDEREKIQEDIVLLKKMHSVELDTLSMKSLGDFMQWSDDRKNSLKNNK